MLIVGSSFKPTEVKPRFALAVGKAGRISGVEIKKKRNLHQRVANNRHSCYTMNMSRTPGTEDWQPA